MFGNLDKDRTAMFVEAIDQILAIWSGEPPYDLGAVLERLDRAHADPGARPGHDRQALPAAASADRGDRGGAVLQGRGRGGGARLGPDLGQLSPAAVGQDPLAELRGGLRAGRPDARSRGTGGSPRASSSPTTAATARRYATDPAGPYYFYYRSLFTKLKAAGRANLFKTYRDQPDEALNVATIVEQLVIYGTPDEVAEQILAFRDEIGDFGTLLYAGHDWMDKKLARRSMELMAEQVMPAVNRAIA